MKHRAILLLSSIVCTSLALAQYIPRDLYDEDYNASIGYWENNGQIIDGLGIRQM